MSNVFDHGHNGGGGGGELGQQVQGDGTLLCYFHPREVLVGVCAHCLRERLLLLLASKQQGGRARVPADGASYLSARPYCRALRRVRTGSIVSVLALGSSLLHRLDSSSRHHHHPDVVVHGDDDEKVDPGADDAQDDDCASVASLDDSFISIKFEDNGKATWMESRKSDVAGGEAAANKDLRPAVAATTKAVVEHVKQQRGGATRWRKQVVGRLLQLARWKRAATTGGGKQSAASACHAAEQQPAKGRSGRGWIRSLTRRRAAHGHGDKAWS